MNDRSAKIRFLLKSCIIVLGIYILAPQSGFSQEKSDSARYLKNTIRMNLTNPMIFGSNYRVFGYERVVSDHQTFSVNIGRFAFPKLVGHAIDTLGISNQYDDKGFHFSGDYRFYLRKENKYLAPRGIYMGPYYAFNSFSRNLVWQLNTTSFKGEVDTDVHLKANMVGAQLGYQFVLWNRVSIDMILMGPGVWFFNLKTNVNTTLDADDESLLLERLNEILQEKFPGRDLVIHGGGFEAKKTTTTKSMGFRYMVTLGFRF